jgi:hypothetical protein
LVNIKIHKTYTLTVDKNVTKKFNENESTEVIGNSSHKSADTDLESTAPLGIKGTGTLLGAGVLQPYWTAETAAWTQWPVFIPSVPWPPGIPVPPAPPIINMALNGLKAALLSADSTAMANGAKSIK